MSKMKQLIAVIVIIGGGIVLFNMFFSQEAPTTKYSNTTNSPIVVDSVEQPDTANNSWGNDTEAAAIDAQGQQDVLALDTSPELIVQLEQSMQFSPANKGDFSHMAPEAETVQINEEFPAIKPDLALILPSNLEIIDESNDMQIGKPLPRDTKMDDGQ